MTAIRLLTHQLRFEQLTFWRNRSGVFFTFVFPLLLLVLIGGTGDAEYRAFLIPGIAALALVGTTFQGLSISLAIHRDQGVLKRLRATPMSAAALLGARILSVALVAVLELVLIVVVGQLLYDVQWPEAPLTLVAVCFAGGLVFCALGVALTAFMKSGDTAPAVANAVYLPLMFLSGIFYKTSELPNWLERFAHALPLYHLAAPLRAAYVEGHPSDLWKHLGVLALWGAFGMFYAIRRFHWSPSR